MCFSASADLVSGIALVGVGVDALRHHRGPRELVLAALPALFAAHQLVETLVWWGLEGRVPWTLGRAALWAYLLFALVALPVLVPVAVGLVETDRRRRRIITALGTGGAVLGGGLLLTLLRGPVTAELARHHIRYDIGLQSGGKLAFVYVLVTCGALLASSDRHITLFGIVNLAAVTVLAWVIVTGVTSLWCAWAAVTSVLIAAHLRARRDRTAPLPSR